MPRGGSIAGGGGDNVMAVEVNTGLNYVPGVVEATNVIGMEMKDENVVGVKGMDEQKNEWCGSS